MSGSNPSNNQGSFYHIVFANNREYDFRFSTETSSALALKTEGCQDLAAKELSEFISPLPLKSKIIRRFQRFGEDAEYDEGDALEILTSSFMAARSAYINQGSLDDHSFPSLLVEEVNNSVDEAYVGDAVTEWSLLNGIEGEVATLVEDAGKHFDVILDAESIVEQVMDSCDKAAEEFVKKNDVSTGLDLLSQEGGLQMLMAPYASAIDDGDNTLKIDDFNQVGVGGLRPDNATLSLLRMSGLTPQDVVVELRDELSPELLSEWSDASKSFNADLTTGRGTVNIQDVLDIVEQCGEKGGIPVLVTEVDPAFFSHVNAGDNIQISRAGVTMIPHDKSVELPGVSVLEGPIEFKFQPEQLVPAESIGIDFVKEASLKAGEVSADAKVMDLALDAQLDSEYSL